MEISSTSIPTPFITSPELNSALLNRSSAPTEHAAAEFESVFVSMLLKEMRSTLEGGMFGDDKSDTFGGLFDLYMGQHLADQGGLGIKQMISARIGEINDK